MGICLACLPGFDLFWHTSTRKPSLRQNHQSVLFCSRMKIQENVCEDLKGTTQCTMRGAGENVLKGRTKRSNTNQRASNISHTTPTQSYLQHSKVVYSWKCLFIIKFPWNVISGNESQYISSDLYQRKHMLNRNNALYTKINVKSLYKFSFPDILNKGNKLQNVKQYRDSSKHCQVGTA